MRLVATAVLALAALAASSNAATPTVTCASIIDPGAGTEWRPKRVVLGVVAIPAAYIPQTVRSGSTRWPWWSKAGMVVRAGSEPVTVSVPPRWRNRVAIGWGNIDTTASLRFETCPEASSLEGWNAYAGGFQLRVRSACVPVTFRVGDRSATVRFGVGKRCR